jgi:hypothetical protein
VLSQAVMPYVRPPSVSVNTYRASSFRRSRFSVQSRWHVISILSSCTYSGSLLLVAWGMNTQTHIWTRTLTLLLRALDWQMLRR